MHEACFVKRFEVRYRQMCQAKRGNDWHSLGLELDKGVVSFASLVLAYRNALTLHMREIKNEIERKAHSESSRTKQKDKTRQERKHSIGATIG